MIICSCNVLSDHGVRIAVATGKPLHTISGLFRYLGCTAQCGRCARSIKRIMDEPACRANAHRVGQRPLPDAEIGNVEVS
jgi:bacterioferritin-associated ferredoxin